VSEFPTREPFEESDLGSDDLFGVTALSLGMFSVGVRATRIG
jgi:hypothetical protein